MSSEKVANSLCPVVFVQSHNNTFSSLSKTDLNKGTVSPAERCDFVGVKLEKVHELFQVCRICGKDL